MHKLQLHDTSCEIARNYQQSQAIFDTFSTKSLNEAF